MFLALSNIERLTYKLDCFVHSLNFIQTHIHTTMSSGPHEPPIDGLHGLHTNANYGTVKDFLHSISDTLRRCTETRVTGSAQPLMEYREVHETDDDDDGADDELLFDKAQPDVTAWKTVKEMLLASWMNSLLVFVFIGVATHMTGMNPLLVFTCNAIAIIPLSALLTDATERIALTAGDAVGALLNISFGNLVELILFIIALVNDQIYIVQASIFGSIIVNLLLILGSALVAGTAVNTDPVYNSSETQLLACLLFVSVFVVLMPTAFTYTIEAPDGNRGPALQMSRVSALIVLMIYVLYFAHEVHSRPEDSDVSDLEEGTVEVAEAPHEPVLPNYSNIISPQPLHPRTIRFADEAGSNHPSSFSHAKGNDLSSEQGYADAADYDAQSELSFHRGRDSSGHRRNTSAFSNSSYHPSRRFNRFSRSLSRGSSRGFSRESSMSGDTRPVATLQFLMENRAEMETFVHSRPSAGNDTRGAKVACVAVLVVSSLLMSACGEFLVSTIDQVTHESGVLSKPFIGLVILPIVGNIAEYVTVVTVGVRGKLDLAIAVAVGSSIQISLCVTPLTVLAGWALRKNLGLTFSFFEMATLLGSVLLVNLLILNESGSTLRTAGLKGALMCACYVIFSMGAYLSP